MGEIIANAIQWALLITVAAMYVYMVYKTYKVEKELSEEE